MTENELAKIVVNTAFTIHNQYGPGLFESVYEEIMFYELVKLKAGFRADLIVEDKALIEIKSVEALAPVHYKQVTTDLKLTNIKLGLLINFNVALIKNGMQRIVNNL